MSELIEQVRRAVETFAPGVEQADDMTMLLVKRLR